MKTLSFWIIGFMVAVLVIGSNAAYAAANGQIIVSKAEEGSSSIILGNATFHVSRIFYNVDYANPNPFYSATGHGYAIGDEIIIKGQTLSDEGIPLGNVTISGALVFKGQIMKQTVSDKNGNFEIGIQTPKDVPAETEIEPTLTAQYNGTSYSWNGDMILDDIKKFTISEEGKNSTVLIRQQDGKAVSLVLDKNQKKLTLLLNAEKGGSFMVLIPSDLLSGDIMMQVNKNQTISIPNEQGWISKLANSYSLLAWKYNGFVMIDYESVNADASELDVLGTTVIPEFPYDIPILVISLVSLFIFYRIKSISFISKP